MPLRSAIAKRAKLFSRPQHAEGESAQRLRFSQRFECKSDGSRYDEPEPRLFSFNNPYGACPRCQGFGNTIDIDLDLVIPDKGKTLNGRRHRALDEAKVWPFRNSSASRASLKFRWTFPGMTWMAAAAAHRRGRSRVWRHSGVFSAS